MSNEIYSEVSKSIIGSSVIEVKRNPQLLIHFQVSILVLLSLFTTVDYAHKVVPFVRVLAPLGLVLSIMVFTKF